MTYQMAKHVAVVVRQADSDGLAYFTVNMVGTYESMLEFPTLENAQSAAEATAHSQGYGFAYGWVHNSDLDTWSAFVLRPTDMMVSASEPLPGNW